MTDFIVQCTAKVPAQITVTADTPDDAVAQVVHDMTIADVLATVTDPEQGEVEVAQTTVVPPEAPSAETPVTQVEASSAEASPPS